MRIFNVDGSEVAACGNATRCVASLILGLQRGDKMVIQTRFVWMDRVVCYGVGEIERGG